jgi:transposase InsO family protein
VPETIPDKAPPQVQSVGGTPFENLTVDFTEMPQARGCKYLLVFVCTFSGWVEAFPTWTEKAWEVARCLLKEIIPQFGVPVSIGSDIGPAFVAEVVQLVAKGLGITWKLFKAYCPQSSGKVERMNRTPKLNWENYAGRPIYNGISYCP